MLLECDWFISINAVNSRNSLQTLRNSMFGMSWTRNHSSFSDLFPGNFTSASGFNEIVWRMKLTWGIMGCDSIAGPFAVIHCLLGLGATFWRKMFTKVWRRQGTTHAFHFNLYTCLFHRILLFCTAHEQFTVPENCRNVMVYNSAFNQSVMLWHVFNCVISSDYSN